MEQNRIKEKLNEYSGSIIKKDYTSYLMNITCRAYDENKAVEGGYKILSSHNQITKDIIKDSLHSHNTDKIFDKVKKKFYEEYGFETTDLEIISNRTMGMMNAFCTEKYVFFDRMLEDVLHSFFMVTVIWAKYIEKEDLYGRFFNYLTAVLCAAIIDNGTCNLYKFEHIKKEIDEWTNTVNLAVSCQYFCMYFCVAHEIAHSYIRTQKKNMNKKQEEFMADTIAYNIVLQLMIEEESETQVEERELFEYCYLAPIMLFDFWDLVFYADRVINKKYIMENKEHPEIKKRKENLFSIPYKEEYQFETKDGNTVYGAFLDVIDKYKTELLLRKDRGSLDDFIKYIRRE